MASKAKVQRRLGESGSGTWPGTDTNQTRGSNYSGVDRSAGDAALTTCGELYNRVQRKLFADVAPGRPGRSLKRAYLRRYGIPARMFNGVRVSLESKVASVREQQKLRKHDLSARIKGAKKQVAGLAEQGSWDQDHQKRRRLANLHHRLAALEADIAVGRVLLCFGSRRLWRKQHHLKANGYSSHEELLRDWQTARSDEFFVLGSRDGMSGCQLCVATVADDGTLTMRLRVPGALATEQGKYLFMAGVWFRYGHDQMLASLGNNAEYARCRRQHGEKVARLSGLGQATSYRFRRDGKGWRVFLKTQMVAAPAVTNKTRGAIGVDLNADHLAVSETDGDGNWVRSWRAPLVTYGKSQHQAEALIGDAVASIVAYAGTSASPSCWRNWTSKSRKLPWRGSLAATAGCCPP